MVSIADRTGGRFLSLFRKKIDTLALKYHDDAGSLQPMNAMLVIPPALADSDGTLAFAD